ncbi:hypothetical protein BDV32DRAFT_147761 [Aspergillus pseudonomiae]|uniref:Uncharacterized protein n=1 Tax=Aspergillus pseudonomiae TaxID=1506151 RepID=A0A5N6I614_9EURO|nr:uncharacterized protein BDV37DRAFT_284496 [Aspergillus pseudonomiae]KAB8262112.1 hypothetical protein BDV32DRAFT_147761 [Aspergillus pseudonomiae]KAE8402690.1 hypothetical protein BDV37DRAFT_284496 [Aspergillus pseudonomiae]
MAELTVGYVSGIIAAAVFLVRLFVPTVISLIVIGHLPEENSIVSWSVVSRLIHSSYWPTILDSDTAASTGVSRAIKACTWLQLGALGLVAVAGIVTPLGLYDVIGPDDAPTNIPFHYVSDTSAFGRATRSRDGYRSLRICYADDDPNTPEGCPGAPPNINDIEDPAEAYSIWPSSVDLFTSGDVPPTVSSIFDLQWRSFRSTTSFGVNFISSEYSEGYYRQISQLIMEEGILAVEGLIIDTKAGRIGFRNHTIPVDVRTGARWTEDILFIEPEARCVNTNLTIDYTYNPSSETTTIEETRDPVLVDHGGFSSLPHTVNEIDAGDFQNNVALYDRAYNAAWRHNMLVMQFFNVTTNGSDGLEPFAYINSDIGKKFDLRGVSGSYITPLAVQTDNRYAGFLELPFPNNSGAVTSLRDTPEGPNPVNLTALDTFAVATEACHYPSIQDLSNLSFVGVSCGTVFAAPARTDGDPLIPDTNSTWSTPIYSCAAAAKAAIRTVTFSFNGTGELDKLTVEKIEQKRYTGSSKPPLWGVERLTNHTIRNARPLWGIVSPDVATRDDISSVQRDHLWLPGYQDTFISDLQTGQSDMPGNRFYMDRLLSLFDVKDLQKATSRYTGLNDLALYNKWFELSKSAAGVEQMLKLMWTDMAANTVVGTRGWHSAPSARNGETLSKRDGGDVNVPVLLWSQTIKYRLPYAIPAFILLALCLALAAWSIWLLILRRIGLKQMRTYLARTSPGRILGHALHPDQGNILASTEVWLKQIGLRTATLPGQKEDSELPLLDIQQTRTHEEGESDQNTK